ncbi:DNA methyltransferase [Faustovirus]|nr:DNA methyltransferase [Faustovirus]AMN84840.1 DNA methyltransferase [Faustovirus]AMP44028.1 DNA methyltransferase [Faustovirus]
MNEKRDLGQFFTTHYKKILDGFIIPENITNIVEPFCGNGDMLHFIDKTKYQLECYDIDPKQPWIVQRDTLLYPIDYTGKFILTNPPYLARNKAKTKDIFDKYNVNDLYKCFIKQLICNRAAGGIVIIPLNFWSSIRECDIELRKQFVNIYKIIRLNIFEETVFDDTTYTVCAFMFLQKQLYNLDNSNTIEAFMYPSHKVIFTVLSDNNNYQIGGSIYHLEIQGNFTITRLTSKNKLQKNTNIVAKCIDDSAEAKICLKYVNDNAIYIDDTPNLSARTYATLVIMPPIDKQRQKKLVKQFNEFLNNRRDLYDSLFLANYRESKDIARKRISFDLVYLIVIYLLENYD